MKKNKITIFLIIILVIILSIILISKNFNESSQNEINENEVNNSKIEFPINLNENIELNDILFKNIKIEKLNDELYTISMEAYNQNEKEKGNFNIHTNLMDKEGNIILSIQDYHVDNIKPKESIEIVQAFTEFDVRITNVTILSMV